MTNTDTGAECYDLYNPSGSSYAYWKFARSEAPPLIQTQASGNTRLGANSITIMPDGNVGIGDTDPLSALDVTGNFAVKSNNYSYEYYGEAQWGLLPKCSCDIDPGDRSENMTSGIDCGSPVITDQDEGAECYDWYVKVDWTNGARDPIPYSKKYKRYDLNSEGHPPVVYVDTRLGRVGIGTKLPSAELDVRGDINYTGALTNTSDQRLKENITPIVGALNMVRAINGVYYNKLATPNRTEAGVLAQDVQMVLPEAVSVIDQENGYLGVSYNMLVPVLIEAVKELSKENESFKTLLCQDHPEAVFCGK